VHLERVGQLKNPMTSLEMKPVTLQLVAIQQLRYHIPNTYIYKGVFILKSDASKH
jgi:hypothetical protein